MVAERPPFERIALILQGGGALGSYQAGVYQALAEANLHPDWVAGISMRGELGPYRRQSAGEARREIARILGSDH
jgi:predicted patatin/cPLA2 family phospholipase